MQTIMPDTIGIAKGKSKVNFPKPQIFSVLSNYRSIELQYQDVIRQLIPLDMMF